MAHMNDLTEERFQELMDQLADGVMEAECPVCHVVYRLEPDAPPMKCHHCGKGTVSSPLYEMGFI